MMGSSSGSYKGGGSLSSSSNLSPLAPPFMVDKSFTRSSSINPSMNFLELPVYGTVFDPAGPFSSTGHKLGETEPLGSTSCLSSGGVYAYPGSQSSNSDVYYVGLNTGAGYDPFSCDKFPNSMPDRDDVMKPYYGPFISSLDTLSPCKDTYMGSRFDLLSSSGAGHFTGFGSLQVDPTQGVSSGGEEYKPKWSGFWGGLSNSEHEKWPEYAPSCGVKDFKSSDLSSNKSHISIDGCNRSHSLGDMIKNSHAFSDSGSKCHPFGDVNNKSNPKQGACVSQGLDSHGQGSSHLDNSFDIFGGPYPFGSLGMHHQGQNLSFKNLGGSSTDCPRMSGFVSVPASIESPVLQRPLFESVTNFSGSQKASGLSSEDHLSQTGCYMFGCTSTGTSPVTVTSTQYTSPVGSILSGIQVNPVTSKTVCSSYLSAGQDAFYQKEPQSPLGMQDVGFQPGVVMRRPLSSSKLGSSSQKGETMNDGLDVKFVPSITKFTPQVSPQFSSNGFTPKTNDAEASSSIDKHSSGSDLHNPAEDSPCWKGASSTRFSPFSVSEDVSAVIFVSQEDGCKSPRPEEPQKKNLPVDTSDCMDTSEKVSESTLSEKPTVPNCTSENHQGFHPENQKSYCIDLNIPDGLEFLDDCHVSTKDSSISSNPISGLNSKLSLATELILKEAEVLSALNVSEASVAAKSGNYAPATAHNPSDASFGNGNNSSCSALGDKTSSNYSQSIKRSPESRFDVNVLLKIIMKLSQMLRCYCVANPVALTKQHSTSLEQTINNIKASMSEMARHTRQATILPTQESHLLKELQVSEMVNNAEIVAAADRQSRIAEDFLDYSDDDVDAHALLEDDMTHAIKKILYDNLHEGIELPELSYRNLWLEAEAALCIMTAKARFHRMKIEMENGSHDRMKDKQNPSSPKIFSDVLETVGLAPEGKDSPAPVCDCESQKSSATRQCKDTEEIPVSNSQHLILNTMKVGGQQEVIPPLLYAGSPFIFGTDPHGVGEAGGVHDVENSVMARYQILKSHGGDSEPLKKEGKQSSNKVVLSQDTSGVGSGPTKEAHDVETPVMARYQILKSCAGNTDTLDNDGKQSSREENYDFSSRNISSKEGTNVQANDAVTSVMARYQILKCRMSSTDSMYEGKQSSGENYLIAKDCSSPDEQIRSRELFNSISCADDGEAHASVMARFHIIQNRINGSNSVNKEPVSTQANGPAADGTEEQGWAPQKSSFMTNILGPYPVFSKDEDVQKLGVSIDGEPLIAGYKVNKLNTEILEGWYDNDCSSDWEHVSKEELRRQN